MQLRHAPLKLRHKTSYAGSSRGRKPRGKNGHDVLRAGAPPGGGRRRKRGTGRLRRAGGGRRKRGGEEVAKGRAPPPLQDRAEGARREMGPDEVAKGGARVQTWIGGVGSSFQPPSLRTSGRPQATPDRPLAGDRPYILCQAAFGAAPGPPSAVKLSLEPPHAGCRCRRSAPSIGSARTCCNVHGVPSAGGVVALRATRAVADNRRRYSRGRRYGGPREGPLVQIRARIARLRSEAVDDPRYPANPQSMSYGASRY